MKPLFLRLFIAELLKIPDGAEMNVRRIVPLIGDLGRPGHRTGEQQLETAVKMAEVDKADRGTPADPDNAPEQPVRPFHLLKRL